MVDFIEIIIFEAFFPIFNDIVFIVTKPLKTSKLLLDTF
jgi:hypothetical protein